MSPVRRRAAPTSPVMMPNPAYSFESQARQYLPLGEPGIGYFAGVIESHLPPVDCLLWRDTHGLVRGILNHYPIDYPPWEHAGNVNIWVHPDFQRRGIATALVDECEERWGPINFDQQQYSDSGLAFMRAVTGEENDG